MNDNEPQQQLWLSGDVAAALGCACHGPSDVSITGVSIDSRTVGEGDLFFAIKGDRFDGHDFVDGAIEQGASLAVVAHDKLDGLKADASKLLVVDDVLSAMEQLGRAARARLKGRVVAVTGSVGKTGTKEMMRLAFGACGGVHASVASFNNHWGVPLTLSRTPTDADFGIYEIGMNHPGEIVPLVDMVRPDVAIITTVAPVHLEFFDSEVEIARAKAEIFTGIQAGGKAVLNRDNKHFNFLQSLAIEASVDVVTFGETEGCDVALLDVDLQADGSLVQASVFGKEVSYQLSAPGRHLVQNSLAVAAALHLAGCDVEHGLKALGGLEVQKGRGARLELVIEDSSFTLLDESYNANPASMGAAIGLLGAAAVGERGRRIAVLGDMRELGVESDALHADLLAPLLGADIDLVFLSGPHMKALWDALPEKMRGKYAATSDSLAEILPQAVAKGDVVMVKGSLGSRMGLLVDVLTSKYLACD
ncbi:MAG: UDP-N-acetylmuramoylalanyl-D-glutamyl-2,6-diaminopimelate--D-alanyl-D-alanine ligase [Hyphomicrobiales bacterium]